MSTEKKTVAEKQPVVVDINRGNVPVITFDGSYYSYNADKDNIVVHLYVEFGSLPVSIEFAEGGKRTELKTSSISHEIVATLKLNSASLDQLSRSLKDIQRSIQPSKAKKSQ